MPEGPSLYILKELVTDFVGQDIVRADGNMRAIDPARLVGQHILAIRTWGKHLLIEMPELVLRVHFLLFGTWRINERREGRTPRLSIETAKDIFSGVGNIIKNEVLFRIRVHPLSTVGALPAPKLRLLVDEARQYSFDFLEWKRQYLLKQHWLAHAKRICPRCDIPFHKAKLGRTNRRSFYCERCQKRYA